MGSCKLTIGRRGLMPLMKLKFIGIIIEQYGDVID